MSTTFPALDEAQAKLTAKRADLKSIFDEARGGDLSAPLDMAKVKSIDGDSAAKVEAIRARNEEIDVLAKDVARLLVVKQADEASQAGGAGSEPGTQPAPRPEGSKSFTELFLESVAYKERGHNVTSELPISGLMKGFRSSDGMKTLMSESAGFTPDDPRLPLIVPIAMRPVELVDIIPKITTTIPTVTWMEQTTRTNNAAETSEGGSKPEAVIVYTERTSTVRKIAVTLPVTTEQLDDVPQIRSLVENDLETMVRQRLSDQIASGDGSAPNLRGILNTSGIQTQAKGADPTPDAVYKAMVLVMTTGQAVPDTFVTNPLDWQDVRLLRTADGIYIWGNPSQTGPMTIWGLNVLLAQGMTQNTGVVGDFADYSRLVLRQDITVDIGYVNDDFLKNRLTLRAEMRAALLFTRPAAFCSVTGI